MPDGSAARPATPPRSVAAEALTGLLSPRKTLPAKLFYDDEGCRLFAAITRLPEYYLTRTERGLLREVAPRLGAIVPAGGTLVEYGASDEDKAALLLAGSRVGSPLAFRAYVPIDVAGGALHALARRMSRTHPAIMVHPIEADFLHPLDLPPQVAFLPRLGFFPGSTIGNLDPEAARRFLRQARQTLGPFARFLVGADLRKDPSVLIPAYDDAAGITAAFNRNLLARLNREAEADFDPDAFAHRALWNGAEGRIEMHLVSRREQVVHVAGRRVRFARGESIHTENSYKHTPEDFAALARAAGWQVQEVWMDPDCLFSLHLLTTGADP